MNMLSMVRNIFWHATHGFCAVLACQRIVGLPVFSLQMPALDVPSSPERVPGVIEERPRALLFDGFQIGRADPLELHSRTAKCAGSAVEGRSRYSATEVAMFPEESSIKNLGTSCTTRKE